MSFPSGCRAQALHLLILGFVLGFVLGFDRNLRRPEKICNFSDRRGLQA
jgi:hypothetical protein